MLSFHEGDRAGLGADDAVVPLASWAKRFGWDVETAERVLWECDVPTKGALQKGSSVGSDGSDSNLPSSLFQADDSAARVVDAADARVGLWVTHVFPDFVVRALLLAAETEERCLSKRQALDAARAALQDDHPKAALSEAALARGSPVVSLSFGDECVFAIAPSRDAERTRTTLRSGDALIFGGPSRLVYHGVERVKAGTAPAALGMRAGRLNLTFRSVV